MSSVRVALAGSLALLVVAIVLTLVHAPMTVARANGTPKNEEAIAATRVGSTYCQASEVLPRGTRAIRLAMSTATGPRIALAVRDGGRILTSGTRAAGWSGRTVTVGVSPLAHTASGVSVCASFPLRNETLITYGKATSSAVAARDGAKALPGRMWIEYLRPGGSSWASMIPAIVRHMGLARAGEGSWVAYVALVLILAVGALATGLVLREQQT